MLRSLLSTRALEARGLLDPAGVQRLIADHESARVDGTDPLIALMNLEIWCRLFVDGRGHEDVAEEMKGALR